MASLLDVLQSGANGLNVAQGLASTAGHNLSNVNTPGYSRQTANLVNTSTGLPWDPGGVEIASVSQSRDRFLEAQLPASFGQAAYSQAQADSLSAVSALDPSAAQGISSALSDFYNSLRALSQNAGDSGLRQAAVSASQSLARAFNQTAQQIDAARSGLDAQLQGSVGEVNQAAAQVASLNQQIRTARASGADPNDLLDARQQAADQLSQLTGAQPIADAQGNLSMAMPGGQPLVSGTTAASLKTMPDPSGNGHLAVQLVRLDGSGPEAVAGSAIGGKLGGWLQARDGALATAANSVDQLASDVGTAVNTAHRAGFALDGSAGGDLFTFGAVQGAASRMAVTSAIAGNPSLLAAAGSATAGPGDSTNLLSVIGTQGQALSGGSSAGDAFSSIISSFGSASARATAEAAQDSAVSDHLTTLRESTSGVSVDEELVNMQKAQRAYEAIGKVMTTASTMFDALMTLK